MSATTSKAARPSARPAAPRPRLRHTPGGAGLGAQASPEARRLAAAVLEVLAGARTPSQAAAALGVSLPRYFQVEARAVEALVAGCEPRPRGPGRQAERELAALQRQHERLQRELSRQQTLVRLAQRTVGLAPPKAAAEPAGAKAQGQKRRRRPVVRALHAAQRLQQPSPEAAGAEVAPPTAPPDPPAT